VREPARDAGLVLRAEHRYAGPYVNGPKFKLWHIEQPLCEAVWVGNTRFGRAGLSEEGVRGS
jgi:hypothetical protein